MFNSVVSAEGPAYMLWQLHLLKQTLVFKSKTKIKCLERPRSFSRYQTVQHKRGRTLYGKVEECRNSTKNEQGAETNIFKS